MNKQAFEQKILPLIMFLATELMLLVTFNFGDYSIILRIIAFAFVLFLVPLFWQSLELDLANGLFLLLAPVVLYGFATILSPVYGTIDSNLYAETRIFMRRSLFELITNLVGIASFLLLGYFVNLTKIIKREYAFISLFGGIALTLFISLFATVINYGFFHTLKYADKVIFYNGLAYRISNQASLLLGFNIVTVDVNVLINMSLFLASLALGLLFLEKNMSKVLFGSLIAAGALGGLTLVILAAFRPLLYLLPALGVLLIFKFNVQHHHYVKIGVKVLAGLFVFGVILFVLIATNAFSIQTSLAANSLTRRLFLNGYMMRFYLIFSELLTFEFPFGNPYTFSDSSLVIFPSGNIIFDSMRIDGLFGVLMLGFIIIFIARTFIGFVEANEEHAALTFALVSFAITLFIRYMFHYPFYMYIFTKDYWSINYFPLIEDVHFALILFLTGLIFVSKNKGVATNETK